MQWSEQQAAALAAVDVWLLDPRRQVFRLFGPAGTGKTALSRHLGERARGHVQYMAFTGKAASVMRKAGCENATTIHSLIYTTREKSKRRLRDLELQLAQLMRADPPAPFEKLQEVRREIAAEQQRTLQPAFILNAESDLRNADLCCVDECSMVDARMGQDLLSFESKTLVLGDPAQLPPIAGGGFFTNAQPDILLTEIHRQARENPIIDMASRVREGKQLDLGTYGESAVVQREDIGPDTYMNASQILVGKNVTRRRINDRVRTLKGFRSPLPEDGDRLVCLRNNHDLGLLNGTIWTVQAVVHLGSSRLALTVRSEDDESLTVDCEAHTAPFLGQQIADWSERRDAEEFDFGYALTVHKAQGSQWPNVVLIDEWKRGDRKEWLYTGITRAQERVTVVRGF